MLVFFFVIIPTLFGTCQGRYLLGMFRFW